MRVISGSARSLRLKVLSGDSIRPTTDKTKETLFNIINNRVYNSIFIDFCAGSGAIGIEALSRGASEVYFVEKNPKAITCINTNLDFTRLGDRARIINNDAVKSITHELRSIDRCADIIFMDPPYNKSIEEKILRSLSNCSFINKDTLIIAEASIKTDFSYLNQLSMSITRVKEYKTNKHVFINIV